ncbi:PLP-dependent aminotransferase family protein [Microbacterium sp. APC 3898]|uniref:PLP-dependent aminotransferase family protein n=1 Tax=Planococcus notacanthi TaxID=3035188 RepID=A0ABT7ZPS4_9BACL|nr:MULTISPECIES: PLP-dependent aminotransferase family protein [Terrabacteria group]MDN3429145.1 PLP-dependent aminotransferase family protein [Planococcus sp. APC 4016]MDN3501042.1 PLP-dependent aminotransferase family protein [Microbacterium sp. APC 3898]
MDMLMFQLQKQSQTPLYKQLYREIKKAIIEGSIQVDTKLPSKRKLADYLQISQTTVELAYSQLVAEGFIESRPRKGFYAQPVEELAYLDIPQDEPVTKETISYKVDFNSASIDTRSFPFSTWRKLARDILDESSHELLLSGHPQGDDALRQEIARYLYQSRGVICDAEQIVIGSGTEQLLPLLIRLLDKTLVFGYENPGYALTHSIFNHHDRQSVPIELDSDGLNVSELEASNVDVAYVTPSHQFPSGSVLSATKRAQLLNWAAAKPERYIIEDDYDSEFRYTSRPIPALQSMDRSDRVIYLSTFSKSLMPSLRLAYMVLPKRLLRAYQQTFLHYSSSVPRHDQQMVATFMKDGHFARHLNRMRKLYQKKIKQLSASLALYAPTVIVSGEQAGMHIVLTVQTTLTEKELVTRAQEAGIRVTGMESYDVHKKDNPHPKIVLGFGGLSEKEIHSGITELMSCWEIH